MIISLSKKFIFIHNPKTAGSSVQKALQFWDDGKHLKRKTKHETFLQLKERDVLDLSNFFIFGFVRNPWDRFSSFFHFLKKHNDRFPEFNFIHDVNQLAQNITEPWLCDRYSIKSQEEYFDDSVTIGRYENLFQDFDRITRRIGINAKLPKLNTSIKHNYRQLFNKEGKQIIQDYYTSDIKTFGYKFSEK